MLVFPAVGHVVMEDDPARTAEALGNFAERQCGSTSTHTVVLPGGKVPWQDVCTQLTSFLQDNPSPGGTTTVKACFNVIAKGRVRFSRMLMKGKKESIFFFHFNFQSIADATFLLLLPVLALVHAVGWVARVPISGLKLFGRAACLLLTPRAVHNLGLGLVGHVSLVLVKFHALGTLRIVTHGCVNAATTGSWRAVGAVLCRGGWEEGLALAASNDDRSRV